MTCNTCIPRVRSRSNSQSIQYSVCCHTNSGNKLNQLKDGASLDGRVSRMNLYYPKLCARHRIPSICSSETSQYRMKKARRYRSCMSNASDLASSVDLNEFKSSRSYTRKLSTSSSRTDVSLKASSSSKYLKVPRRSSKVYLPPTERLNIEEEKQKTKLVQANEDFVLLDVASPSKPVKTHKESLNKVHFHLNMTDDEDEDKKNDKISIQQESEQQSRKKPKSIDQEMVNKTPTVLSNSNILIENGNQIENERKNNRVIMETPNDVKQIAQLNTDNVGAINETKRNKPSMNEDKIEWDSYWDSLELNAVGEIK